MGQSFSHGKEFAKEYSMGGKIGAGTFATVRKVTRKSDKKAMAAKIILRAAMETKENSSDDEVEIMKSANHPNIIKMQAIFETKTKVILVLELMDGDLADKLDDVFTERQAAKITQQIAAGLDYLHKHGITHRDLKPENVLLNSLKAEYPEAKLTDFGTAKICKDSQLMKSACGSPSYVAPEILNRKKYGPKVDIWALGIILYRVLSGELPFVAKDGSRAKLYNMIKRGEVKFKGDVWKNVEPSKPGCAGVQDLILKLLNSDPEKRPSAEEVLQHDWIVALAGVKKPTPPDLVKASRFDMTKTAAAPAPAPASASASAPAPAPAAAPAPAPAACSSSSSNSPQQKSAPSAQSSADEQENKGGITFHMSKPGSTNPPYASPQQNPVPILENVKTQGTLIASSA